jgi:PST family polysaccharide transporter
VDDAPEYLQDVDPALIGRRASQGVLFLLIRYGGIQLVGLIANIALSRLLAPSAFGIYAITLALLVFFAWLSDFGLGAALLQKREAITETDLRSVFTVQQGVLGVLVIAALVAAPWLASRYHIPGGAAYFQAMAIGALFASLKTVPNIVIERKLLYGRLTVVEISEVLLFQGTAVLLAVMNFGAWSFIWAVVISKAVGLVMTFFLAGWRPRIGLDAKALGDLWWFAVPFQATWITYIFRDYLIPMLGGLLLYPVQVGYLNWAFALAGVPGQMAQVVGRVSFPTYSRLQDDRERMARAIDASIRLLFVAAIPTHLAMIALGRWLIEFVFSDKWLPSLLPLYLLSVYWAGTSITSPLVSALNALGKVRSTLILNLVWTVGQIALAVLLVRPYGYAGIALAFAVTRVFASAVVVVLVRREVPIELGRSVAMPLAASVAVAALGYGATQILAPSLATLIALGLAMAGAYAGLLWLVDRRRLRTEIGALLTQFQPAIEK